MVGGVCLYMRMLSSYFGVDEGEGLCITGGEACRTKGGGAASPSPAAAHAQKSLL